MGTYLTVVVSGWCDDNSEIEGGNDGGVDDGNGDDEWYDVVTFWWCVVLVTVGFSDVECPFGVVVVIRDGVADDDDDAVEWNELTVVEVIGEPNEKCGIVFWSILFSTISDSTISASSWMNEEMKATFIHILVCHTKAKMLEKERKYKKKKEQIECESSCYL